MSASISKTKSDVCSFLDKTWCVLFHGCSVVPIGNSGKQKKPTLVLEKSEISRECSFREIENGEYLWFVPQSVTKPETAQCSTNPHNTTTKANYSNWKFYLTISAIMCLPALALLAARWADALRKRKTSVTSTNLNRAKAHWLDKFWRIAAIITSGGARLRYT